MSVPLDEFEDELELLFIAETFHRSEPIREKPIQTIISRVWIREKRQKVKDINGVQIKQEPKPKIPLSQRFQELQDLRQQSGVEFDTDPIEEDDDDDQYEDTDDEMTNEELSLGTSKGMSRNTKSKLSINLAKKLKKRAIANRLGIAYNAAKSTRLKDLRSRLGTTKSWSEKFGQLLAAKKLLYLPLLFRKYKCGPMKTREELDIELDLYMSETRNNRKLQLGYDLIKEAIDNEDEDNNNGIKVINPKEIFGGFGGPGWRKGANKVKPEKDKDTLDMELDQYMANKDSQQPSKAERNSFVAKQEELDMELDQYMATVKEKTKMSNGF